MSKSIKPGYFAAIIAGLSFGTIPVISAILRDLNVSSVEQTFLRISLGALFGFVVIILYLIRHKSQVLKSWKGSLQKIYIVQSIVFVLMIFVYLSSVALKTPVGEAALLVQLHPFITLTLGFKFLNEEITKKKIVAILLALLGLVLLTEPWAWENFLSVLVGDLFAIGNGVLYAIYLLIGRASAEKRKNVPYILSISWVLFWSVLVAIPITLVITFLPFPSTLTSFSLINIVDPQIMLIGVTFAVFGSIIPYGLIMVALKQIESSKTSILLLGEPVGAMVLGALLLNELITFWYLIGGALIIIAVIITTYSRKEKFPTSVRRN